MTSIYVAGPVLRIDPLQMQSTELERVYDKLSNAARRAKVDLRLPIHAKWASTLSRPNRSCSRSGGASRPPTRSSRWFPLRVAGARPGISVTAEAHWAVRAGKPVVLLGTGEFLFSPPRVPGLSFFRIELLYDVLDLGPVFSMLTAKR